MQAAGDLSAWEAQEEGALQELCMDILGSLDVSVRGMSKRGADRTARRTPGSPFRQLHVSRPTADAPDTAGTTAGKDESFPDTAEFERRLLKFLKASLDTIEEKAWIEALSCELSQRLSSSASSSAEKSFLYKALGTVLGSCKGVLHVQEKLLQHLEEANAEEPREAQGIISLLSHAAENNFHTVLATLTMFASRLCKGRNARISRRKKVELDSTRAHATRSEIQMLSEPVWRALVKGLSDFSSVFPPVIKLKPSFESKDLREMLVLCCKNIVTHPSAEKAQ
ncbi:uncharacterized protein LOC122155935 [Centrocercus urophasianus]|uniref:uncharacterized protein LOC122155935 n=1 Tax=Centrocercus urophasianus TaxID=9002 RepID=UPI001C65327E|nr:uncharacterized protein LOC122155935 [Centrocercus urophasianus]